MFPLFTLFVMSQWLQTSSGNEKSTNQTCIIECNLVVWGVDLKDNK